MRIAFVFHDAELYGASLSALDLAAALRYRDQKCIFILPKEGPLTSVLKKNGFEFHIIAYNNWAVYKTSLYQSPYVSDNKIIRFFKLLRFVTKHMVLALQVKARIGKIDWVYSNNSLVIFGFFLAMVTRVRHVWQFREFIGEGKDYVHIISATIRKFVYRRTPKFIFGTHALKNYYAAETGNKGIAIYDPVDCDEASLPVQGEVINAAKTITLGMLGSVNQNKGQLEIAAFFAKLSIKYHNLRLLVAGEGETEKLKDFIAQNQLSGIVQTHQYMDSRLFYESVDYVVINSKFEGFGRVAIEAMKNYKPVIGRNSTGTAELLGNNERGLLFEDEKSFTEVIDKIISGHADMKSILHDACKWAQKNTMPVDVADRVIEYLQPGFKPEGKDNIFATIYRHNVWGDAESASGPGSTQVQTAIVRRVLPEICEVYGIKRFLDIPCGDLNWMRLVNLGNVQYIGADVISNLIIANEKKFKSTGREFQVLDLMSDKLPGVDLVFCRDCLVHFSYTDIYKALANIRRSNIKYLLATTFNERKKNEDIQTGNWRPLNLEAPPFNFPKPKQLIVEECTENESMYADKCLGLWEVNDIKIP